MLHMVISNAFNVTKYSSAVIKYKVLVPYLSISSLYNFVLLLHHVSEANIVHFTPLYLSDSFSYFSGYNFS